MSVALTLGFDDPGAVTRSLVGGKGANLGLLTQAGFPVPPGFVVTTAGYGMFLDSKDLRLEMMRILDKVDYGDTDQLEALSAEIRRMIIETDVPPALAKSITSSYERLGAELLVAVRSSGTAEDLAEASFAGLHDTYLDRRGAADVLCAVRRCWASLWTSRATSYRSFKGIDQTEVGLAVVVQAMVDSEVAGVMFTGNPMTTANDEFVINSCWGLGESVVSGITTPDQFIVKAKSSRVRERILGGKRLQVVRDPATGVGTVEQVVADADQGRYSLDDEQLAGLTDLGRRVMSYYDGVPQDIEWGWADGLFALLQSRPITGVEFSWDDECERWQAGEEDDDEIRTRQFADEAWTGAVSPLMYSWRAWAWQQGHNEAAQAWGLPELAEMRYWRFYKAEVYYSTEIEMFELEKLFYKDFRPMLTADRLPPALHEVAHNGPAPTVLEWIWKYARIQMRTPERGLYSWFNTLYAKHIRGFAVTTAGLPNEDLRRMSDGELRDYCQKMIQHEAIYYADVWHAFFVYCRDIFPLFGTLLTKWYDGQHSMAFIELLTGTQQRTATAIESSALWHMGQTIRNSPGLKQIFEANPGAGFFTALEKTPEGEMFLATYRAFVADHGHRGHEDRDIYFPRRADDPAIDYRALQAFVNGEVEVPNPEVQEARVNARREEVLDDVLANVSRKPLGAARAEIIKVVYGWCQRFLAARDDERHYVDRSTYSIRRGFLEISRRLMERGVLAHERHVFFLSKEELYEALEGNANLAYMQRKIDARARDFDRFYNREAIPPRFIKGYQAFDADVARRDVGSDADGVLVGLGTSRGTVTGTARVIGHLKDIGRLRQGEILVTHSTDPGWAAAFAVMKGIVTETGGMLAHASCLAREYGLPAAQVEDAMRRIPDCAEITINGDTGVVVIDSPAEMVAG